MCLSCNAIVPSRALIASACAWIVEDLPLASDALCMEQSEEWLAGRVYLDMGKLDAASDDQVPLAAVVTEEVKSMAA